MRSVRGKTLPVVRGLAFLLVVPQVYGYTVLHMSLGQLVDRSEKIFRGKLLDITPGTLQYGGGEIETTTYTFEPVEVLKDANPASKDGQTISITMLGSVKQAPAVAGAQRVSVLPEMPELLVGGEYLLLTTAPGPSGLSTTVGLGQGCFDIFHDGGKAEMALNRVNNQGLFDGPVAYTDLVAAIQNELGQ